MVLTPSTHLSMHPQSNRHNVAKIELRAGMYEVERLVASYFLCTRLVWYTGVHNLASSFPV